MNEPELKTITPIKFPPPAEQPDEIASIRLDMLRFATNQLRDKHEAEDAVQEALTAALAGLDNFKNHSKLKTWVYAILTNKIKDIIKKRSRSQNKNVLTNEVSEDRIDEFFDEQGGWDEETCTSHWETPEKSYSNQEFWVIFEACLNRLPENTSRVFMMREMLGLETNEICCELSIHANNCAQILYRARLHLSVCLDEKWFKSGGHSA